jgi:uncharacterized protein (DUF1697 family)
MQTYIAILRGVNVSGKNSLKMVDLKNLMENLNYKNIKTYIQSGNVLFNSSAIDTKKIADKIEEKIKQQFGMLVPVIVMSKEELEQTFAINPFLKKVTGIEHLYCTFLSDIPNAENCKKIQGNFDDDEFEIVGKTVFLYCPKTYGNTKLNNNYIEKKLGLTATTRNWKTISALIALLLEK